MAQLDFLRSIPPHFVHLSLFSPVGCLTFYVFHVCPLVCSYLPLHCSVSFPVLLLVSLFRLLRIGLHDFPLQGSPVLDGMPGCDPLFLFFCRRPKKDSLVWVYAVLTWSHMVLIPVVSGSTLVSCKYWGTTDSPIMDLQRRILTTEAKQEARWEEHFSEVLNRPPPATKAEILKQT